MDTASSIDYSACHLNQASLHQVGNRTLGEELRLSAAPLDLSDIKLRELLIHYFFPSFKGIAFYHFNLNHSEFEENPVYRLAARLFDEPDLFHEASINFAKHHYEIADNQNIPDGELFVAHFSDVVLDGRNTEAIGIFKSESRQAFLKPRFDTNDFAVGYDAGISTEKLDKGCLIFNTEREEGFRVTIVDKTAKGFAPQYWKDDFLRLRQCHDEFHQTKDFMKVTKAYISKQLGQEFELSEVEKADLINQSLDYFKSNQQFDKADFENSVLRNRHVIDSFRNFDEAYQTEHDIRIGDRFDISPEAVKDQSRVFRSVIKLDKNFHIYVHGDKELIRQGVDPDGRKYYKIYFHNEA